MGEKQEHTPLADEVEALRAERDELKEALEVPHRFAATLMRLIRAAHEAEPAIAQAYGALLADKMDEAEGPGRGRHVRSLLQDLASGEPPRTVTLQSALAAERRKVAELEAELALRRKSGSAVDRLHNLCEGIAESADGSEWSREEWERIDAENADLRRKVAELERKVDELEAEAKDDEATRTMMADILKRTAVALRGPEPDGLRYGWGDLPERASAAIAAADVMQRAAAENGRKVAELERLYRRAINCANGLTNYVEDRPELRKIERDLEAIESAFRAALAATEGRAK